MPWFLGNTSGFLRGIGPFPGGALLLLAWSLFWKGMALWHAARRNEKLWFILLLILNTVGILEIVYLVFVAKAFAPVAQPEPAKKTKSRK
jgi:hypothetical protein